MDPPDNATQVQPPASAGLPVLRTRAASPEAFRRAPTLLAGQTAGSQGPVQVWSPNKTRLKLLLAGMLAVGGPAVALMVAYHFYLVGMSGYFVFYLLAMGYVAATIRRPCYVTMDDAGIGIITWKGSKSLRWADIHAIDFPCGVWIMGQQPRLNIEGAPGAVINLWGYSSKERRAIFAAIATRAGLKDTGPSAVEPGSRAVRPATPAAKLDWRQKCDAILERALMSPSQRKPPSIRLRLIRILRAETMMSEEDAEGRVDDFIHRRALQEPGRGSLLLQSPPQDTRGDGR